jgi:hypothetical protein
LGKGVGQPRQLAVPMVMPDAELNGDEFHPRLDAPLLSSALKTGLLSGGARW